MAHVNSYDGYIFDYGGVLVHHQTEADQVHMAKIAGIPQPEFSELYWSNRFDYDKGLIGGIEYWSSIGNAAGQIPAPETIADLIQLDNQTWMRFDEVMWEWVDELRKASKAVAMLSNMPGDLGEALKADTDRLKVFNQVTLSYEVHSVKPEPAIYEHCLEELGTDPAHTLFLDDRIANVQGAELLGIQAMEFLNRDDVLRHLRA
jgi:putative hydrolase of the HAD superfamily